MNISESFTNIGEYGAAGMYEEENKSLFYRKALGIRRYYENCPLKEYNGELLYPSGVLPKNALIHPSYMDGMNINYDELSLKNKTLADIFVADFKKYASLVPTEHTVAGNMWTHSMPNYERILKEGLLSYIPRINKIEDIDIRDGLIHIIEGIKSYLNRIICYLESVNADKSLINALKKVPLNPAGNIYDAVVCWNFIMYLDNCDNLGCVASGLYPYYNGENIVQLLENLFENLDLNDGYSMALDENYNELTIQCLEASKGKRRPMIELFVSKDTPQSIWDKAFEVMKTNGGQPAFYNGRILFEGLKKKFPSISNEDIKKFCGGGCTESMIAGFSNVGSLDAGINLLLILEQTIYESLEKCKTFDEFYDFYIKEVYGVVNTVTDKISASQLKRAEFNPLPMRTLLIDDCIDNGKEYNNGGARYKWSIINFAGLINVIDSMLVIKELIFDKKELSSEMLIKYLKENSEKFLNRARQNDICFGINNNVSDNFSKKISTDIFSMLDNEKPAIGEAFLPASIQFHSQTRAGKKVGATPDGRKAYSPLCDSLGAIFGKDTKGPTSLLNSVTSLNLEKALGIPVLNFNTTPQCDNAILKSLIISYMNMGGIQMQITCISKETLLDAYKNPDMHKNIVVRVGGYSEYFSNLSDELKKMVIDRTIQNI